VSIRAASREAGSVTPPPTSELMPPRKKCFRSGDPEIEKACHLALDVSQGYSEEGGYQVRPQCSQSYECGEGARRRQSYCMWLESVQSDDGDRWQDRSFECWNFGTTNITRGDCQIEKAGKQVKEVTALVCCS
jgi:hypothetical protein